MRARQAQQLVFVAGPPVIFLAGQWLALSAAAMTLGDFALGFILFRLFDILKPWPANWADRSLHGGWGVMLDDVAAGAYAALCLLAVRYFVG